MAQYQFLTNECNLDICGPKGGRLLELFHLGLPVPPLVCVPAGVYVRHVARIEEFKDFLGSNSVDVTTAMGLAAVIRGKLLAIDLDDGLKRDVEIFFKQVAGSAVAVRSSCVGLEDGSGFAFAGQFETFLNQKTVDDVLLAVRKVWASLWSERILSFIQVGKMTDSIIATMAKASMAVVIQAQIDSRSSGICFSKNPDPIVSGEKKECAVCESVWGQGQGIVDGSITPDKWIIGREDSLAGKILSAEIAEKSERIILTGEGGYEHLACPSELKDQPSLTDDEVVRVASFVMKLESHYARPQDMEFAVDNDGHLYVLQTRPITSLVDDWAPDPFPDGLPPCPFPPSDYSPPDTTKTYFLDHLHVTSPLSLLTSAIAHEHLNRGFRDAASYYGAPQVNQIHVINGCVYGHQMSLTRDEEAVSRSRRVFEDRAYLKELDEWNVRKGELITAHLQLQARIESIANASKAEVAALLADAWKHLEWCMYLHGRYAWPHRLIIGDLLVNVEDWTDGQVSGLDLLNIMAGITVGTPNMRLPVLIKIINAFNNSPFACQFLLNFSPETNKEAFQCAHFDGSPVQDAPWRSAHEMLHALAALAFYQYTPDALSHVGLAVRTAWQHAHAAKPALPQKLLERELSAEVTQELKDAIKMFIDWHGFVLCGSTDINCATYLESPNILISILQDAVRRFGVNLQSGEKPGLAEKLDQEPQTIIESDPLFLKVCEKLKSPDMLAPFKTQFWEAFQCSILKNERVIYTDSWANGILRKILLWVGDDLVGRGIIANRGYLFEIPQDKIIEYYLQQTPLQPMQKDEIDRYQAIAIYKSVAGFAGVPKRLGAVGKKGGPAGQADDQRIVKAVMTFRKYVGHADDSGGSGNKDLPGDLVQKIQRGYGLSGIAASHGVVDGFARYIDNPARIPLLKQGEIAIITQASPAFSGVLASCSGVVTEQGGILCHIAICARELKLPAVVGCGNKPKAGSKLTPKMLDGMRVRLHGNFGVVEVIGRKQMKLAVLGATGRSGRLVVQMALAQGHHVRALVRAQSVAKAEELFDNTNGMRHNLEIVVGEALNPDDVINLCAGCDAIVNNVGPRNIPECKTEISDSTLACLAAMKIHNITRYLVQGAILLLKRPGSEKMWCEDSTVYPPFFKNSVSDMLKTKKILEESNADYLMACCGRYIEGKGAQNTTLLVEESLRSTDWRSRVFIDDLARFLLQEACAPEFHSRALVGVESNDAMLLNLGESEAFQAK